MRILIVEDDDALAQILYQHLIAQHHVIDIATDGLEGWEHIQSITYDLILLDIDLPYLNGIELCKRLRAHQHKEPVLLLTARSEIENKVQGLDAGADDYLAKPYSIEELLARMRALLRRQDSGSGEPLIRWGPLCIDPKLCKLMVDEQSLALSPKEYQLMELFLRHPQQVLSSDQILDRIWGFDEIPGKDTVRTHVRRLRKKLKPVGAEHWIETVYGLGYRLKALSEEPQKQHATNDDKEGLPDSPSPIGEKKPLSSTALLPPPQTVTPRSSSSTVDCALFQDPAPSKTARQMSQALWPKFRPKAIDHLLAIEDAIASFEQQSPNHKTLWREGERAAHKLIGTLGMFGMPDGSDCAQHIEALFQKNSAPLSQKDNGKHPLILQLNHHCQILRHLLEVGDAPQRRSEAVAPALINYDQALRDINNYFCIARRHHHVITLAWVQLTDAERSSNGPSSSMGDINQMQQDIMAPETIHSVFQSWAISVQASLRTEDIVTQCAAHTMLVVLFECSKENAISRLQPFIQQLSQQLVSQPETTQERSFAPFPDEPPNLTVSSIRLATFPQDGQTLEDLKNLAFQTAPYLGNIVENAWAS